MAWLTAVLIVVLCIMKNISTTKDTSCKPRPVIKILGDVTVVTQPRVYVVNECSGFDEIKGMARTHDKCVPVQREDKIVEVKSIHTGESRPITLVNHVKCKMMHVCDTDHDGSKKLHDYIPCPDGLAWNKSVCKCLPEKVVVEPRKSIIGGSGGYGFQILITAMVGQFILTMTVLFIGYHCRKYRQKQHHRELCAQYSVNQSEVPVITVHDGKESQTIVHNKHCLRSVPPNDTLSDGSNDV